MLTWVQILNVHLHVPAMAIQRCIWWCSAFNKSLQSQKHTKQPAKRHAWLPVTGALPRPLKRNYSTILTHPSPDLFPLPCHPPFTKQHSPTPQFGLLMGTLLIGSHKAVNSQETYVAQDLATQSQMLFKITNSYRKFPIARIVRFLNKRPNIPHISYWHIK